MEPLLITLLTISGLWALKSKSKKSKKSTKSNISKPTISFSLRGLELTCSQIEITNQIQFENYIDLILANFKKQTPNFIVSNSSEYLSVLENCYLQIQKDYNLKCSSKVSKSEDERAIIYLIKQKLSGEYNKLILGPVNATSLKNYMESIVDPAMNILISNLKLIGKTDLIWANFLYTGKYPNLNYKIPEEIGFQIGCGIESYIQIYDLEKFDQYLKNIVKELSLRYQFKDPYTIEFEKFIDEYLKIINNNCYQTFHHNTISDQGKKILYVLIQYGLQNYIDLKFTNNKSKEEYYDAFFTDEWEYLQNTYEGINDEDIYELEMTLRDQGSL